MKCRETICRLDPKSWRLTENDVFAKTSLEGQFRVCPLVHLIKLYFLLSMLLEDKLECLSLISVYKLV